MKLTPIAEKSATAFINDLRATYQNWQDPLGEFGEVKEPKDFSDPIFKEYQVTYGAATLVVTEERKAQGPTIQRFEININQLSDRVYSDELVLIVLKSLGATKDDLVAVSKASERDYNSPNGMDDWPVTLHGHKYLVSHGKGHYIMMESSR